MGKYADIDTSNWREQHHKNYRAHKAKREAMDPPGEYRPEEYVYPDDIFDLIELAWKTPEIRALFEDVYPPDRTEPLGPEPLTNEQRSLLMAFEFWFDLTLPYSPVNLGIWRLGPRCRTENRINDPRDPLVIERCRESLTTFRVAVASSEADKNFEKMGREE